MLVSIMWSVELTMVDCYKPLQIGRNMCYGFVIIVIEGMILGWLLPSKMWEIREVA